VLELGASSLPRLFTDRIQSHIQWPPIHRIPKVQALRGNGPGREFSYPHHAVP
jgi:hypothetical protein